MTAGVGATQTAENSQYVAQASDGSNASVIVNNYLQGLAKPQPVASDVLAVARARFAALPLDTIPEAAPLPGGSHMPLLPNPLFVGRSPELQALAAALKAGTAAVGEAIAATGMGGIGKMQLASAFAYRYGQFFAGGVFWLSFAQADAVPAGIARCGGPSALHLHPGYDGLALPDQLGLVAAAFASELPRLLIFDNCEDEALLETWLPRSGAARVLVTSRRRQWSAGLSVRAVPLGVLPRDESIALLRRFRPDLAADDPDLDAIATELGDLPLALHMAGSFLKRYRHATTPAAYLAELRAPGLLDHPSLTRALEHSPTAHEQHVARTFALSLDKLTAADRTDVLARDLLDRAAFFAPGEPIPRALLIAAAQPRLPRGGLLRFLVSLFRQQSTVHPHCAEDALKRLTDLGLIEEEADGAVRLHRLLAAFVGARCDNGDGARTAVEAALGDEASRLSGGGLPASMVALQPHLRAVAAAAEHAGSGLAGFLYHELGYHLRMIADLAGAKAYCRRALAMLEKAYGPDHPNVATAVNNLGAVLRAEGDLAGAKAHYQRALKIDEKAYGPDHPDVARDVNNLGFVLRQEGDLAGAKAHYQRALAIVEDAYGPDHPNVATTVNNLGDVLQEEGDLAGAKAHFQRALGIDEKAYGADHPDVARDVNNLGDVLHEEGDLAGAKAHFQRALEIDEKAYGLDHPKVAIRVNNLGGVLRQEGDLAGAKAHFQRALKICEKAYGPDHPARARCAGT